MKHYYSHFAKFDTWLKVGFEGDKITLDVPEDGTIQQGWKITAMSTRVVSLYCTQFACVCLNCMPAPEVKCSMLSYFSQSCTIVYRSLGTMLMALRKVSGSPSVN